MDKHDPRQASLAQGTSDIIIAYAAQAEDILSGASPVLVKPGSSHLEQVSTICCTTLGLMAQFAPEKLEIVADAFAEFSNSDPETQEQIKGRVDTLVNEFPNNGDNMLLSLTEATKMVSVLKPANT